MTQIFKILDQGCESFPIILFIVVYECVENVQCVSSFEKSF